MTTSTPPPRQRRREELVVHLRRPADLVVVEPRDAMDDHGPVRLVSGAEELLGELLARPRPRQARRVVLTLPRGLPESTDETPRLAGVLARWCRARMEHTERQSRLSWRQGLWSLRGGTLLFVLGLVLSTDFLAPDVPPLLQEALGNGVFLVIAWIGLWYPLDLLFFARSPARREMRALDLLARLPVEVRRPTPPTDGRDPPTTWAEPEPWCSF